MQAKHWMGTIKPSWFKVLPWMEKTATMEKAGNTLEVFAIPRLGNGHSNKLLIHQIEELIKNHK